MSNAAFHGEVENVGEGIRGATVNDPLGNVFGIIENPHVQPDPAG